MPRCERWTVIIDDLDRDGAPETPWTAAIFHTDEGGLRAHDPAAHGPLLARVSLAST